MPVPASIDDLSTTASSNSPAGADTPKDGDNYIRALSAFIAQLRDQLDGTSATGTINDATFSGTMAGAATWSDIQTFASAPAFLATPTGKVTAGTWTPTGTSVSNNASAPSPGTGFYTRVGDIVTFSVIVSVEPTSASTATIFDLSLPIASSFTTAAQAIGTAASINPTTFGNGAVFSNATDDRLQVRFQNGTSTGSRGIYVTGQYIVV